MSPEMMTVCGAGDHLRPQVTQRDPVTVALQAGPVHGWEGAGASVSVRDNVGRTSRLCQSSRATFSVTAAALRLHFLIYKRKFKNTSFSGDCED